MDVNCRCLENREAGTSLRRERFGGVILNYTMMAA